MPNEKEYRLLKDERIFQLVSSDVHHQRGLECIDCHNSYELMGDGNIYAHQEEQVKIKCEDCHFNGSPNYVGYEMLDAESKKIAKLRKLDEANHKYLITSKDSIPLINSYVNNDDAVYMVGKNTNKKFELKPPNFRIICSVVNLTFPISFSPCYTKLINWSTFWGAGHCHKETIGTWKEWMGDFIAKPPTLGIIVNNFGEEVIETFVPGMIMTIDKSKFDEDESASIFHRLFAPTVAHTTSAKGRSCKSCHNDPLAIGYGRGELIYRSGGYWRFQNKYTLDSNDNLPEDAWIGFLNSNQGKATRVGARPFTIDEQKGILTVGACLTCHNENSKIMLASLKDFDELLKRVSSKCVLPKWD